MPTEHNNTGNFALQLLAVSKYNNEINKHTYWNSAIREFFILFQSIFT